MDCTSEVNFNQDDITQPWHLKCCTLPPNRINLFMYFIFFFFFLLKETRNGFNGSCTNKIWLESKSDLSESAIVNHFPGDCVSVVRIWESETFFILFYSIFFFFFLISSSSMFLFVIFESYLVEKSFPFGKKNEPEFFLFVASLKDYKIPLKIIKQRQRIR